MSDRIRKINKKWIVLAVIAVIGLTAYLIYAFFGDFFSTLFQLLEHGNQAEIAAYLNSQSTAGGYAALFFISILQVVSIVIPGLVIQITGALIYGWWRSFLICWIGFTAGNALVFFIARLFGKSIQIAMDNEKKTTWLEKMIKKGNPILVFAVACMIPGIPNGIIPYVAARCDITLKDFTAAVLCSSWIQILLNCVAGHFLIRGQWTFLVLAIALQVVLILVVIRNRDKIVRRA
jgi:uncharacterized membrane protein YdjX (TVP38/TMEM64 family)